MIRPMRMQETSPWFSKTIDLWPGRTHNSPDLLAHEPSDAGSLSGRRIIDPPRQEQFSQERIEGFLDPVVRRAACVLLITQRCNEPLQHQHRAFCRVI